VGHFGYGIVLAVQHVVVLKWKYATRQVEVGQVEVRLPHGAFDRGQIGIRQVVLSQVEVQVLMHQREAEAVGFDRPEHRYCLAGCVSHGAP
jgi:hypothetical protein